MKIRLNSRTTRIVLIGLCITSVLAASALIIAGQESNSVGPRDSSPSASDSDRTYCVTMGYLYKTTPGLNGGLPICQFSDSSWCDAHSFATGKCSPGRSDGFYNQYGIYYPYYYDYPYNYPNAGLTPGATANACTSNGGIVTSVHTPYGDVDVCKFPNGKVVDLNDLYNGLLRNNWNYYAYNWLNAP